MKTALLYIIILLVSFSAYGQEKNNINYLKKNKHSYLIQNGLNGPIRTMSKFVYQGVVVNGIHTHKETAWRNINYYFDKNGRCLKIEVLMREDGMLTKGAIDSFVYNNDSMAYIHKEAVGPNEITYFKWLNENTLSEISCFMLSEKWHVRTITPYKEKLTYFYNGQIALKKEFDLPNKTITSIRRYHLGGNIITNSRSEDEWSPAILTISKDHHKNPTKTIVIFDIPDSFNFEEIKYEYY